MRYFIFCILFFNISSSFSQEYWLHRAHEYIGGEFKYTKECLEVNDEELLELFDFSLLNNSKWSGIELDVFYRSDIEKLVIYHGDRKSSGQKQFQCFNNKYISVATFLKVFKGLYPKMPIWFDVKNKDLRGLSGTVDYLKLNKIQNSIVETKSLIAIYWINQAGLKSSYWGKFRGDSPFSRWVNKMKINLISAFVTPHRFSLACRDLLAKSYLFIAKEELMCWNTGGKKIKNFNQKKMIEGLKVILEGIE